MTEQDLGAIELPRAGPRRSSAIDARNEQWRATEPGRLVNFCCAVGVCSERPGDLAIDLWRATERRTWPKWMRPAEPYGREAERFGGRAIAVGCG